MNREEIVKALNWRYATKVFDATKKVEEEDLKAILESGRLAPSSFGIEAWKFIVGDRKSISRLTPRSAKFQAWRSFPMLADDSGAIFAESKAVSPRAAHGARQETLRSRSLR